LGLRTPTGGKTQLFADTTGDGGANFEIDLADTIASGSDGRKSDGCMARRAI